MGDELKTVGFAASVCMGCSLLLAAVYSGLKEEQDINKANDLKVKVLQAFGLDITDAKGRRTVSTEEINQIFTSRVQGFVLDRTGSPTDKHVADLTAEEINDRDPQDGLKQYYPYYVYTDPETGDKRYAVHVSGMGLWSVVKGYLALAPDGATVAGIAFYDHAETPGLGGEVEKPFFRDRFKGKRLADGGRPAYFRVLKPGEKTDASSVNGISGATMTCKGVQAFINSDYAVYHRHFATKDGA